MKKKTTWAASVVRKQLQTCCQQETLSHSTLGRDDFSEGFELPLEIHVSSTVKGPPLPSLLRRKSFNVSQAKNLLRTPESLTPHRKSVESALPLCAGLAFKPRRLQYVKSSSNLVAASAVAAPPPMLLSRPLPTRLEAPKGRVHPKSGPLPMSRHSTKERAMEMNSSSPVKLRKYLSGPLPSTQRKPSSGSSSPPVKRNFVSGPWNGGGKPKQVGGGPSPTNRFTKVKSSAQALFPAVATSKLPGMVTQGALKKATQLAKVTPVLDRKGSRGSRASRGDQNLGAATPMEVNSRATATKIPLAKGVVSGISTPVTGDDGVQYYANPIFRSGRTRKSSGFSERERIVAAVKIQAAIRGYRARRRYAIELTRAHNPSGELTEEELEEAPSISTQMSRTNPQKRNTALGPRARRMEQVSKSWNGSLRTAQDCQALLKSKQEAALKRERAMDYAMSRQNWKISSGSKSQKTAPALIVDNTFPDKPGWVWNWLERAARMGAHNSPNRNFDDDFDNNEPVSESLSVKSTVGICTTEIESATDMDLTCPMTYPWPLSLRQQHAAGLLQPKAPLVRPPPLEKQSQGTPETPQQRDLRMKNRHSSELQEFDCKREDVSTMTDSCVASQMSDEFSMSKPRFGVRKLRFAEDDERQNDDGESVGSCVGPLPTLYRSSSPFANPKVSLQLRMSNPNSSREATRVNPQAQGLLSQGKHVQRQVVGALSDSDSADTTAASLRRPIWRP